MNHNTLTKAAMFFAIITIITGCAPTSRVVENHSYNADLAGLKINQSYLPTVVYTRPGSPSFESYGSFIVDPVMVSYDNPDMGELNPDTVAKMQSYFHDSLVRSLREGGYEVGNKAESNTLKISLHLSGLKAPSAIPNITSIVAPFVISVGEVNVEAQFREAVSDRLDIVAVANTQGSRLINAKPWSTWADIEAAFDLWVTGIRREIDKAHKK